MVAGMDSRGWDQRFTDNPNHFGTEPNTLLKRHVSGLVPGTAADVGCGQGRNTVWLLDRGWDVTAVDFSEVALRHTHEAAQAAQQTEKAQEPQAAGTTPVLTTVQADVSEWRPADTFDLVVAAYLHLPSEKLRATWRHLASVTAPGGTLVVIGHDRANRGNGPKDPDVLFHADDVVAALPDTWTVKVAEAVDRGEGSIDALVVATAPHA